MQFGERETVLRRAHVPWPPTPLADSACHPVATPETHAHGLKPDYAFSQIDYTIFHHLLSPAAAAGRAPAEDFGTREYSTVMYEGVLFNYHTRHTI